MENNTPLSIAERYGTVLRTPAPLECLWDLSDTRWHVVQSACRIEWDQYDVVRFLNKCYWQGECLIYTGAKSCGGGQTGRNQYGSFWSKGKVVRAHKFGAVALKGLRPEPGDELDHGCCNTRCVWCLEVVRPEEHRFLTLSRRRG